jgi:hypothetical protein
MRPSELRREIDWYIQNRLTLSAPVFKRRARRERIRSKLDPEPRARLDALASGYDLSAWATVCSPREYLLNLHVLDMLDRHLPHPPAMRRGLDIGSGNWSYLPALVSWSRSPWDGVELDAHRRDWTLATRRAYAACMMRTCRDCRYFPGALTEFGGTYEGITWFLPYVRAETFSTTRLPRRYFAPEPMLAHAWSLLAPGGTMFVVNQGEEEMFVQDRLFARSGINAHCTGLLDSGFSPFHRPRYGWVARKTL